MKPITIVGGGLAGLTLGIGLRRKGVPVTICEAGHYPRHRVCGEFISGQGQDALARLGLCEPLVEAGAISARTATFVLGELQSPVRPLPVAALCLSRFEMDAVLARHFCDLGGELRQQERWRDNDAGEGVVWANGRRAQTRERGWRWFGLKVHARNVASVADLEMHGSANGYVGITRLKDSEFNVCGLFRRPAAAREGAPAWTDAIKTIGRRAWLREKAAEGSRTPKPSAAQCALEKRASVLECGCPLPLSSAGGRDRHFTSHSAWTELLRGAPGTPLRARLADAVFDESSFCSIAGLSLRPQRARDRSECCVGDALTMIPPVTGNGMSMAFEAAELAIAPVAAYGRGEFTWARASQTLARACDEAFSRRLAWARWLQWMMFAPALRRGLGRVMLNSELVWQVMFARTR